MMNKLYLSFITLLFSVKAFSQPYNTDGDAFFGAASIHDIKLTFYQSNYWDSLVDAYNGDYYISADIEIDGTVLTNCGAKFKGNSSYNNPSLKKSFKLDFNEFVSGQKYDELKKLNLNNCFKDPSFLREKLMLDFLQFKGIDAPRCTYARVYINNTYWGLYTVVEEIDKTFLKNRYDDKKGNLFKGDPIGDLKWLGAFASSYYPKYELKTNETLNDWTDLVNLINKLNNTSIANLPDTLSNYFELNDYYYTWAAHILFGNLDSYAGSGHNYYIYHDSLINKFRFITWDVNEAFGNFNQGMTVSQMENLSIYYVPTPAGGRPLHERLLQNTLAKQKYEDALCDLVNLDFSIWNLEAKIDSLANVLRNDVYADPNKFYTNQNFEDNINTNTTVSGGMGMNIIPGIKSYLTNRRNAVSSELTAAGCVVGINDFEQNSNVEVYPNPTQSEISLKGLEPNKQWTISIYDNLGRLLDEFVWNSERKINLANYKKTGVYFVRIQDADNLLYYFKKIIVI